VARKHHNPGCPCCECYDETFTSDYSSFETSEGEFVAGLGSFAVPYWGLVESEILESGEQTVGESWFHTVEIRGGSLSPGDRFDLEWDGITFEVRDNDGTISNGTHSSVFVPKVGHADGPIHYAITLWVTPSWYAVIVTPPGVNRGSVQVIDRDNTTASKSLKITAVEGGLKIASWRIADSTVSVEGGYMYGEITRECPKPDKLGFCTERFYQTQVSLLDSLTFTTKVDGYLHVEKSDPFRYECEYENTAEDILDLRDVWGSLLTTYSISACGFSGFLEIDGLGSPWQQPTPRVELSASQLITLPDSTPEVQYPKLVARYLSKIEAAISPANETFEGTCESLVSDSAQADVVFASDGKAPIEVDLELLDLDSVYFDCNDLDTCTDGPGEGFFTRVMKSATMNWIAE